MDSLDSAEKQVDSVNAGAEVTEEQRMQHRSQGDDWNQIMWMCAQQPAPPLLRCIPHRQPSTSTIAN
jgi:hypothetical protein